jgi:hypothetical protein
MEILIIALIAGAVGATVLSVCVIRRYKGGLFAPIYPLEHYTRLDLTAREDRFLNRHVSRVRVQSSNNDRK